MSKHHNKQNCKPCDKKCIKYDSWCSSEDSCGQIKEKVRTIVIKQHKFCQERKECKRWGRTIKCEGSWESVERCHEPAKLVKKCHGKKH